MDQSIVNVFKFLEQLGFFDVVIPFLLVFAIVYGILQKTLVLGKESKNPNLIVSAVVGLFVVGFIQYVNLMNEIVRWFGIIIVMVICFILIYGVFGKRPLASDMKKSAESIKKDFSSSSGGSSSGNSSSGSSGSSSGSSSSGSSSSGSKPSSSAPAFKGSSGKGWQDMDRWTPGKDKFNE